MENVKTNWLKAGLLSVLGLTLFLTMSAVTFAAFTDDLMVDDGEMLTVVGGSNVIAVDDAANDCDTPISVTLTAGTYTPTDLAAHMTTQISASLTNNATAIYNYETRKFTIGGDTDGDSICWADALTTAETLLGYPAANDLDIDTTPSVSDTAQSIGDRIYLTSTVGSDSVLLEMEIDVTGAGDSLERVTITAPTGYNITGWNLFNDDDGYDAADAIDTPDMDSNAGATVGCDDTNATTGSGTNCAFEITGTGSNTLLLDLQTVVADTQTLVIQLWVDAATTAAQSGNWTVAMADNNATPVTETQTFQTVTADNGDVVFEVYPASDPLDGDVDQGLTTSVYIYDPDGANFEIGATAWATTKKTLVSGMALYQDGTEFTTTGGANGTFDYAVTGTDERLVASDATFDFDGITIIRAASAADTTDPDISAMTVNTSSNQNLVTFTLTEPLINDTLTIDANHSIASTASIGNISSSTGLVFAGIGTWVDTDAQPNTSTLTGCNTVAIDDTLTVITVTANGTNADCYFTNTATGVAADATSDDFTPAGTFIADAAANTTDTTAIGTGAITVTAGWDVTPTATPLGFEKTGVTTTADTFGWQANTDSTFGTYSILSSTSSGITAASGATQWGGVTNDTALTTVSTATTNVTGLTANTVYYVRLAALDPAGNMALSANEITITGGAGGGGQTDATPPAEPTGFAATTDGKTVSLAWTEATDTDFAETRVYKAEEGDNYFFVSAKTKGTTSYEDSNVTLGKTYKYKVVSVDKAGNESASPTPLEVKVVAPVVVEPVVTATASVTLATVGESGQSGTATLTETDGKTTVVLALTGGTADVAQPAHIHAGTCGSGGAITYALTDLTNTSATDAEGVVTVTGASSTELEVTIAELKAAEQYINVHTSADDLATIKACGALPYVAPPEEVEIPETTTESVTPDETGKVVEETTIKVADQTSYATIPAETTITTSEGTPYTGAFVPPTPLAEQPEVMPAEGKKKASSVVKIGAEGTKITTDKPVIVYVELGSDITLGNVFAINERMVDADTGEVTYEEKGVCTVVAAGDKYLAKCELSSFSEFVILESEPEEEVVEEEEEVVEEEEEVEDAPFVDTASHWAKDYVSDLYAKEIVSGKDETHYAPDDAVTRAEFTKIVVGAFDLDMVSTTGSFSDTDSHWGSKYIEAAKAAGVVGGYEDGTFGPDAEINRAEALKILLEAAEVSLTAAAADFPDVASDAWYAKYVNYAAANEIVGGYSDGTFGPDRSITRGEVAKVVSLIIAE